MHGSTWGSANDTDIVYVNTEFVEWVIEASWSVLSVAEGPGIDYILRSHRVLCLILNWPKWISIYLNCILSNCISSLFLNHLSIFHNFILKQIFHHNHPLESTSFWKQLRSLQRLLLLFPVSLHGSLQHGEIPSLSFGSAFDHGSVGEQKTTPKEITLQGSPKTYPHQNRKFEKSSTQKYL